MPNQIQDAPIRAQLHTDIQAAHTGANVPKKIHDGRPLLAKTLADLPYYVISAPSVAQGQEGNGLKRVGQGLSYRITGTFALPAAPTPIATTQVLRANELMALLSANVGYSAAGVYRMVSAVEFSDGPIEDLEGAFNFTLTFQVTVIEQY